MKSLFLAPLLISLASAIWPKPISYTHGDTILWISKDVSFNQAGASNVGSLNFQNLNGAGSYVLLQNTNSTSDLQEHDGSYQKKLHRRFDDNDQYWWTGGNASRDEHEGVTGDDIVDYGIKQTHKTIFENGFYPWKFHPRNWEEPNQEEATWIQSINLELLEEDPDDVAKPRAGVVDESYALSLTESGDATIRANSSVGIARGLNTLTQLFYKHSKGGSYTPLAPVEIYDAPKFEHRGINLDVARQWFEVEDIKRMIDAAAYNKMNRFHLHATDSQSWPLEIPSLPDLAEKGAYRPDLIYSVEDFKDIQEHAAVQGVELITEIDMPGHTSSIWFGYPDLVAAFNAQPNWDTYAAEPPSGTLKLNSSAVNKFLDTLFNDLLPRVYPYSSYFHTGGDEVNKNAYELDDTVRSKDQEVLQPLMQKFMDRNHEQVRSLGLTPVVWEEMLLDWNLTLGDDVVVQSWQSDQAVAQIVAKGHKALVGNYKYWVGVILYGIP